MGEFVDTPERRFMKQGARQSILSLRSAARDVGATLIGIVGFSGAWQDNARPEVKSTVERVINGLFDRVAEPEPVWCVSGATDFGVPAVAYAIAKQRDLYCVGVTAGEAQQFPLAALDRLVVVGDRFGDESRVFVDVCDRFWMIGGGSQAETEMRMAAHLGKPITVVRGVGGRADVLTKRDLPNARFISADESLQSDGSSNSKRSHSRRWS